MEFLSELNVLNRSPYQNTQALIFINFEEMTVKLSPHVPLFILSLLIQIQQRRISLCVWHISQTLLEELMTSCLFLK